MVIEPILFGILQGIFEWLPISSQGNLVILMVGFFGLSVSDALSYAVFLHTGTMLAAIVYFRKEIWTLLKNLPNYRFKNDTENNRTTNFLIITTLLTGIIGYPIFKYMQASRFAGEVFIAIVGIALILTGLIQKFAKVRGRKDYKDLSIVDSIILGLSQALSAIPGISRSGITTSTLLFRNYDAQTALALSFLMSIPAVLAAEVGLGLMDGLGTLPFNNIIIGIFFAFISGLASIHILIQVARKIKFWKFCIILGIISLLPLLFYI